MINKYNILRNEAYPISSYFIAMNIWRNVLYKYP